jgi:hypothetical protein
MYAVPRMVVFCDSARMSSNCSKTSLIQTNWEGTLVEISESLNYRSATENMFREVLKRTSHVFLSNRTLFSNLYAYHSKYTCHKSKYVSFDISLKNILGSLHA